MINLQGTALTEFPYKDFTHVSDLLYFEGPLLVHYKNESQRDFFYHWADEDDNGNRWLIYRVERQTIIDYLKGVTELREVLEKTPSDFITVLDINAEGRYYNIQLVEIKNLPFDYWPIADSRYELPIPIVYNEWLAQSIEHLPETNRTHHTLLKEKAIYVTVRPVSLRNGTAPEVPQMVSYLHNINNSYSKYGEVNFTKRFASRTNDSRAFKKQLRDLKEYNVLRGVEFGTGSFGVALAPDFFPAAGNVDQDVYDWLKQLPIQFQKEVIDADFNNPEVVETLRASYTAEELDQFLTPFFKIIDAEDYQVSLANTQFKPITQPIRANEKVREVLIDIPREQSNTTEELPEREIVTVVLEKNKDQDIKKMGRKIFSSIIASKTVSEFPIELNVMQWQKQRFILREPMELNAKFDGKNYVVRSESMNVEGSGKTSDEAVKQLSERLAREYIRLKGMISDFMNEADKLRLSTFEILLSTT